MNAEEPILVIAPPRKLRLAIGWGFATYSLFACIFFFSSFLSSWEEVSEWWMRVLFILGSLLFAFLGIHVLRNHWELRLLERELMVIENGKTWSSSYDDIEQFQMKRAFGMQHGPAPLDIFFRSGQSVQIPRDHSFDVMEIIQRRTTRSIPGYEKEHLTITANRV